MGSWDHRRMNASSDFTPLIQPVAADDGEAWRVVVWLAWLQQHRPPAGVYRTARKINSLHQCNLRCMCFYHSCIYQDRIALVGKNMCLMLC